MKYPVIPLAKSETEAFAIFNQLIKNGIDSVVGKNIEVNWGNYTHILQREERIRQVPWIAPTCSHPDKVIRYITAKRKEISQVNIDFIKRIREDEDDRPGTLFLVGTREIHKILRVRTWFRPFEQEKYIDSLVKRGKVIWQSKEDR